LFTKFRRVNKTAIITITKTYQTLHHEFFYFLFKSMLMKSRNLVLLGSDVNESLIPSSCTNFIIYYFYY